jgi:hypothetical protein
MADYDKPLIHVIDTGGNRVPAILGSLIPVSATFTRPADTAAYAALDTVSNSTSAPTVLTFANIARVSGGSGYLVKARLMTNLSTDTKRYRLHLFYVAPTAINDNSPYTLLYANAANRIGEVTFNACTTEGTGSTAARSMRDDFRLSFNTSGSRDLYGILETLDAGTPSSAQQYFIEITGDVN